MNGITIFEIDFCNPDYLFQLRWEQYMGYPIKSGKGMYEGVISTCYIAHSADFYEFMENHANDYEFVKNQECVLEVTECNKQYATLVYADGRRESVGSLQAVSKEEAAAAGNYTYRPDIDTYFTTYAGNPDKVRNEINGKVVR